jgi:hypothetical protein
VWATLARRSPSFLRPLAAVILSLGIACAGSAHADDATDRKIADAARREARDMVVRDLLGHYDLTELEVVRVEDLRGRVSAERDSRRQYSLDGYLLLEGRDKDGYVLPPKP